MQKSLGFFCKGRSGGGLYGVAEAENGLLLAIANYGFWDKIVVWSDQRTLPTIEHPKIEVRAAQELSNDIESGRIDLIHHIGLGSSDFSNVQRARQVPVFTSIFPALSYNQQLRVHIHEALSRKTNRDVNIFPSHCSKLVASNIYEQLSCAGLSINGRVRELVIPVGVDVELFSPCTSEERAQIRKREGLDQSAIVVVSVTRFSPSDKADLMPLLRSLRYSDFEDGDFLLLLAGGDNYSGSSKYIEMLQREINSLDLGDCVRLRVSNDRSRVVELIRGSDVFISPADSIQETFGITPVEAMSAGLPVIVSDWNGYRETVIPGVTGFLARTTFFDNHEIWGRAQNYADFRFQHLLIGQSVVVDTDEMVRRCCELSRDSGKRLKMAAEARKNVLQNFDWKIVISQYESLWRSAIADNGHFLSGNDFPSGLNYFETFKNYASEIGHDDCAFEISSFGADVVKGRRPLQVMLDLSGFLSVNTVQCILSSLRERNGSVRELALRFPEIDANSIRFCLSWMEKQRIVRSIPTKST